MSSPDYLAQIERPPRLSAARYTDTRACRAVSTDTLDREDGSAMLSKRGVAGLG